jgi:hypothetical protein
VSIVPPDREPVRLLASDASVSPAVRNLLLTPPPVKPLDAHVAMRVRGAVLQAPGAAASVAKATSAASSQPLALAKLGVVAATAALFGAGVMTLVSGYVNSPSGQFGSANDRSGVVVVSATTQQQSSHRLADGSATAARLAASGKGSLANLGPGSAAANPIGAATHSDVNSASDQASHGFGTDGARDDFDPNNQKLSSAASRSDSSSALGSGALGSGALGSGALGSGARNGDAVDPPSGGALPANTPPGAGPVERSSGSAVLSVDDLASIEEDPFHDATRRRASTDSRVLVRPAFRRIASSSAADTARNSLVRAADRRVMSSLEEETLLLEEARTKLGRDPETALSLALEHQSRFRRGQLLEQRRMIHLEALLRLGRDKEALELAKSIGNSLYQARAQALLAKYGI